jgi:hypothetical protein
MSSGAFTRKVQPNKRLAHTGSRAMRLPGYLIAFVLALLLASTTPVGTGTGAHQLDLLHPLFSHVHLVNGRLLTHEQLAREVSTSEARSTPGPAVGSGETAGTPDGLGISPVGLWLVSEILPSESHGFVSEDMRTPLSREEAPPKPPPL